MKPPQEDDDELDRVASAWTTSLEVRCPGSAHARGEDACIVCDVECDGSVEVLLTHVERDALCCAAIGRPFEDWLLPRLVKLGLLQRKDGRVSLTPAGLSVVGEHCATAS